MLSYFNEMNKILEIRLSNFFHTIPEVMLASS